MKIQSASLVSGLKKWMIPAFVIVCLLILPGIGSGQTPPPPGGGDGNPDNTLAVPFSGYMNLLFLVTAVVYAMITLRRLQKKPVAILKK